MKRRKYTETRQAIKEIGKRAIPGEWEKQVGEETSNMNEAEKQQQEESLKA